MLVMLGSRVRGGRSIVFACFVCFDVAFTIWPMLLTGVAFFGTPSADVLAAAPSGAVNDTGGYYLYDIDEPSCRCCVATSCLAHPPSNAARTEARCRE
jgi:hypothetical protein